MPTSTDPFTGVSTKPAAGAELADLWDISSGLPGAVAKVLPGATTIAGTENTANLDNLLKQINSVSPDALSTLKQTGKNALSLSQGLIPQDVIDTIRDANAGWMAGSGVEGFGQGNARFAKQLGLTSLDLMSKGLDQFGNIMNLTRNAFMPAQIGVESNVPNLADAYNNANAQSLANIEQGRYEQNLKLANEGLNRGQAVNLPGLGQANYSNTMTKPNTTAPPFWETLYPVGDTHGTGENPATNLNVSVGVPGVPGGTNAVGNVAGNPMSLQDLMQKYSTSTGNNSSSAGDFNVPEGWDWGQEQDWFYGW